MAQTIPSGTVTFLFTDIESSTKKWEQYPDAMRSALKRHDEILRIAVESNNRYVFRTTLAGPGGTGKTRLGLQVAADVIDEYEDGVFYVGLDSISNSDLVISTVGRKPGLQVGGDQPIENTLKRYLKEKQILLVLDNFEQVISAAPQVSGLLASCPQLNVLVTSREILHLQCEYSHPVPPLSLPDEASTGLTEPNWYLY